MKEDKLLEARLKDLAQRAYAQNTYTFSAFLTPAELAVLAGMQTELSYIPYTVYGGYELCERRMVCFGSEELFGYEAVWPISILKAEPVNEKFSDALSHRDFLGALMSLGLDRSVLGDILVRDGKRAYIFCQDSIAEFIMENLTKIKHTGVRCTSVKTEEDLSGLAPELVDISVIVAAPRFDAVVAALVKCSRSEARNLFRTDKITLNGREETRCSLPLKEGDLFSVRGYGKYRYCGIGNETRKGRACIHVKQYR